MAERRLRELLRPPTRREILRGVGTAALVTVICWYFGANVWHSILLGCAITVLGFAVTAGGSAAELRDLSWRHSSRRRLGARNEVATLAHSLRSGWDPVGLTAERRLRQIARRRLALEGLDLLDHDQREAIERRIGTRAYRILVPQLGRRPRLRSLIHCLDALDALDAHHYPPSRPRSPWLALPRLPSNLRRSRER